MERSEGVLSVGELNAQIKALLETTFCRVSVRGEVANLTYHTSGHIYFTLKDSSSSIRAVLFKGNARFLKFRLEEGMDLTIHGALSLYLPRGDYQVIAESAEPSGVGALAKAYEQLKKELAALGYFDPARKKPLPPFPQRIALLTSATGAALQDMLRVANKRWPLARLVLFNTLVQGDGAKESIAQNIALADKIGVDVIVVGRGGGSMEDLWAFNERIVAEAIYRAQTPIVSAVGHESDVVISDLVADCRAPTPSSAMEILLPDRSEWLLRLDELQNELERSFKRALAHHQQNLATLQGALERHSPRAQINLKARRIAELKTELTRLMGYHWRYHEGNLRPLQERLAKAWELLYRAKKRELEGYVARYGEVKLGSWGERGYGQIVAQGKVKRVSELERGEEFWLLDDRFKVQAKVLEKREL